jgi:hypothetical protein
MESAALRQVLATATSAVAGAALVAVLSSVPARGEGLPPPTGPTLHSVPVPAPTQVVERPPAWGQIWGVVRRSLAAEHPDAVVDPPVASQGSYLGAIRLLVHYRDRSGSGDVTVDMPPVGQVPRPCAAPGDVASCTRTTRFDGGSVELVVYEIGGHSPVRQMGAVVTVQRADGVVLVATAAASVLSSAELRLVAERAVARVPSLSDAGGGWLRAARS